MEPDATQPKPAFAVQRERFSAVYRVVEEAIASHAFPGCAFGVLSAGEVVLADALGGFTYDQAAPAVGVETVFDVASLTKVVATTAMAMLLHQHGRFDLDTPLGELLPGFVIGRVPGSKARHVKLRHLLAHNSGLPGYVEFFQTATAASDVIRACLELPLEADPGVRAEYSDPGFILLGKALEVISGESLATWVPREVFEPLKMASTGFCPVTPARPSIPPTEEDTSLRHRRIQGEVQDENAWLLKGVAGHAGLFSNVPDLLKLATEILKAGPGTGDAEEDVGLFHPATLTLFAERQGPAGSSRALGWDTPSEKSSSGHHFSPRSIGHLGYSGCSLWIDLEKEIAVALLTNRTWPDRKSQLIREVRPVFHDAIREAL